MTYWRDKVAVITGGSAGLGREFAKALVEQGAQVALVARDGDRLAEVERFLGDTDRVLSVRADITNSADVSALPDRVLERFGDVHLLVNCAGKSSRGEILQTPPEVFRETWELNTLATIRCTQAFAEPLTRTQGHLINIGSLASKFASRYLGAYPTSKFPVAAFSQQLRLEVGSKFHVLLVCPGPIARPDAGRRYDDSNVPANAKQPGGGAKIRGLSPQVVVRKSLMACERRKRELILPAKARVLLVLSALRPSWGDWLLRRFSS